MKKIIINSICLCTISLFVPSCDEELPRYHEFADYTFSGADVTGGDWTPVLTFPYQINIPVPDAVTSSAYLNELDEVRSATSNLTSDQLGIVKYWTNNPVVRWNEIALELSAKYNLIPGPNPDGTYTLPNPAQPAGPPAFPFAHPPYTSRVLAYLSVAQFDGLIAAWHYKFQYNRPAPFKVDAAVRSSYTDNNLPSYPSDGAVVAVASRDILKAMFPLEVTYLDAKAAECLQSLIWAGANVQSDIAAGDSIGKFVAKAALARAKTDGMKNAQTPKAKSDSIRDVAQATFGWHWENLEVPPRPVGLTPLFGAVKMWNVPNVAEVRAPIPPTPGSAEFEVAAKELKDIQKNLTDDQRKIANWWSDGLGSYTPPGHWNRFADDFIIKYKMNPLRSARTLAYMNMAVMDAGIACWDSKYYYHYPRPIATIVGFKTILGTPNFPSYTSGHSTFSAAAAEILAAVFPAEAIQVRAWASEAAESRIYAGIHYRFDAEAGIVQGKAVAQYTLSKMGNDGAD